MEAASFNGEVGAIIVIFYSFIIVNAAFLPYFHVHILTVFKKQLSYQVNSITRGWSDHPWTSLSVQSVGHQLVTEPYPWSSCGFPLAKQSSPQINSKINSIHIHIKLSIYLTILLSFCSPDHTLFSVVS